MAERASIGSDQRKRGGKDRPVHRQHAKTLKQEIFRDFAQQPAGEGLGEYQDRARGGRALVALLSGKGRKDARRHNVNRLAVTQQTACRFRRRRSRLGPRTLQQAVEAPGKKAERIVLSPLSSDHRVDGLVVGIEHETGRDTELAVHVDANVLVGPIRINRGDEVLDRFVPVAVIDELVGEPSLDRGQDGPGHMDGIVDGNSVLASRRENGQPPDQDDTDGEDEGEGKQNMAKHRTPGFRTLIHAGPFLGAFDHGFHPPHLPLVRITGIARSYSHII